ncbi:unnamed protein product, partial [Rotaria sp. Silwood2]
VGENDVSDSEDSSESDASDDETTVVTTVTSSGNDFNDEDEESSFSDEEEQNVDQEPQYDIHQGDLEQSVIFPNSKEFIYLLLKRIRRLISMTHHSSILDGYVRDQIHLKQQ